MSTTALATDALAGDVPAGDALVGRGAPEVAPSPGGAPRRRRIAGTTTEPLPVRACSGEVLGREADAARRGRTDLRLVDDHNATPASARVRRLAVAEEPASARAGRLAGTDEPVSARARRRAVAEVEAPALRLTRRGRMLLTAVSVIIFGSAVAVLGLRVAGVLEPGPDFSHTVSVQVAPGQTLWSIAQSTNPSQDPATVVEKIADLNKLASSADVVPGQTLQIPIAR
ncbi:LysM peptidoglycan-binding domain-containing protein [Kribbella sp. NPDC055071]